MGKRINVALLGLGTVGSGVYKVMKNQLPEMPHKLNAELVITKILVRHPERYQESVEDPSVLTTDFQEILEDPSISIVVEVIGGIEPACTYIMQALKAGKNVVTANKDLMAVIGEIVENIMPLTSDHSS